MYLAEKIAVATCTFAISFSVSGCGGGGDESGGSPTPAPPPPLPKSCGVGQGQCSHCENYKCLGCNEGYKLDEFGVPGGHCVSTCIGQPAPAPPGKPQSPLDLNGKPWPQMCINASSAHFFGIGDWGGVGEPGHTWTNPGKCHDVRRLRASHAGTTNVSFVKDRPCQDADHWAQKYVAKVMGTVATKSKPDYLLNVGDNFYPGGLTTQCGKPGTSNQWVTQFDQVYGIYPDLKGKPWFGVLGNHDYGGTGFLNGWDEQILETWNRNDWLMPGQFWSRRVQYADFAVEYFFLEANTIDARDPADKNHYICQASKAQKGKSCWGYDETTCPIKLKEAFAASKQMVHDRLKDSTAEWHIVVSHYPGPAITGEPEIKDANVKYGIDLVVTGHTHEQLTAVDNGMQYIITGGGGGVTSEIMPSPTGHDNAYGFIDFSINRTHLTYDMYSWGGSNHEEIVMKTVVLESHKYKKTKQTMSKGITV